MNPYGRPVIDLTGKKFGRLTVIRQDGRDDYGRIKWLCECECGRISTIIGNLLKNGTTKSCGCLRSEEVKSHGIRHGMSRSNVYYDWCNMKARCSNPNLANYKNYGGRGISVCERWVDDFQTFYDDVSELPYFGEDGYSLDRINNDGDYEPGNVRWADDVTQCNNTRRTILIEYDGRVLSLMEWARELGINHSTLYYRIKRGWDIERAFTTK